ncbi:hypothetical protein [Microvirga rosea]|uniref:hypothetical protein n=1 Tax=Microvirga rosea TaxID=2715425 RepID=UPI001D0B327F|nr:hypothetical protein [Microvirga rosea]MCB8820071.1 hypothetical protein [Microvirga rosea]
MSARVEISAAMRQRAYDFYCRHQKMTVASIAAFLNISPPTFRRLRTEWSWPPRAEALALAAQEEPAESPASSAGEEVQGTLKDAALALMSVTRSRIDALVVEQRSKKPLDHDKAARTLAAYARTLTTAQALLEQESNTRDDTGHSETAPSRTIEELRDELAGHLERIVAEEEARGSDGLLV